jgi:hypothetical protein
MNEILHDYIKVMEDQVHAEIDTSQIGGLERGEHVGCPMTSIYLGFLYPYSHCSYHRLTRSTSEGENGERDAIMVDKKLPSVDRL